MPPLERFKETYTEQEGSSMNLESVSNDPAFRELALGVAALGIAADRAVHGGILPALSAEQFRRHSMKISGTFVAALWQEAVRDWVETRDDLDVIVGEHYEGGWPELKQGNVHVKIERHHEPNRSQRRASFEMQAYMQPALFPRSDVSPEIESVNVCMTAMMNDEAQISGLEVFAPNGKEIPHFSFTVDADQAKKRAEEWLEARETWVEIIATVQDLGANAVKPLPAVVGTGRRFNSEVNIGQPPISASGQFGDQRPTQLEETGTDD